MTTGLLLINLGTPDAPTTAAVRRYLRQFLGDPRVLDMNPVGRALLLNLVILPTRPAKSAHAYRAIWDATRGSPLLYHGLDLRDAVRAELGDGWQVELGMRYGQPPIAAALAALVAGGVDQIVVLPLFPHTASSSSGSALEELYQLAARQLTVPRLRTIGAFHDDDGFLAAEREVATPILAEQAPDHVLFSFHGLPEHHIRNADPTGRTCLASADCCATLTAANRDCYRAQSFATARAIAARLALADGTWSVGFQSRLGKVPWIKPYTDELLGELRKRDVKRLAVMCPAFVADCLETLEEIGLRAAEDWKALGGESLRLVPSLNATPRWVTAVADLARTAAGGQPSS